MDKLPFQQASFVSALLVERPGDRSLLDEPEVGTFAFERQDAFSTSLMEGGGYRPVTKAAAALNLATLANKMGSAGFYFPLVYSSTIAHRRLAGHPDMMHLRRRPTCTIGFPVRGGSIRSRALGKLGGRGVRRLSRFTSAATTVLSLNGNEAVSAVEHIEERSWKTKAGQDMKSRRQFGFYARLIRDGSVNVRVALCGGQPIAYRIDCRIARTLYVLKWSFDENFGKLSPGFFMIAADLDACCNPEELDLIDLYGSPDALKLAVCDGFNDRTDFAWPKSTWAVSLLGEREQHDWRSLRVLADGLGIRAAYIA